MTTLFALLDAAVLLLIAIALLPVGVLALQVFAAGRGPVPRHIEGGKPPIGNTAAVDPAALPAIAVLVPAHDEELVIGHALLNLVSQKRPQDRIVVVADNCSDRTASIAARHGAEVCERNDAQRRGKGFALAHGVSHLASHEPPSIVVIVDADCTLCDGALMRIAADVQASGRPVQAQYLMHATPGARRRQNVAVFAWRVKNGLRPRGAHRMGWPCHLMGTGMGFPWPLLAGSELAHAGIVEDMQLGMDLAAAGYAPLFCESAVVLSHFAPTRAAEATQRARWERGHLAQIVGRVPALVAIAWRRRDARLFELVLDLCVPPVALLALLVAALTAAAWALALATDRGVVAAATTILAGLFAVAILQAWRLCGQDLLGWPEMYRMPLYALRKLPHYLTLGRRRSARWVKTERTVEGKQ